MIRLAIDAKNLTRHYGNVKAVDDFTLEIPRGTIFGFLGPKGAGKTTLIRLFLGLIKPTAGFCQVLGFDSKTNGEKIRRLSANLFNPPELYDSLMVEINMEFYAWARHLETLERKKMTEDLLNRFDLWDRRKQIVESLNREEKQLLGLATVFLHRHPISFLDEPTAGLSPVKALKVRELLATMLVGRGTTILATESQSEAKRLCDLVGLIDEGKLLKVGRPEDLGLQDCSIQIQFFGKGFTDELFKMIAGQRGVDSATLSEDCLTLKLSRGAENIVALEELIKDAGVEISETRMTEEYTNDIFPKKPPESQIESPFRILRG